MQSSASHRSDRRSDDPGEPESSIRQRQNGEDYSDDGEDTPLFFTHTFGTAFELCISCVYQPLHGVYVTDYATEGTYSAVELR